MRLYERLGFEREGVLRRAVIVDGEAIDVVLLARLLDPAAGAPVAAGNEPEAGSSSSQPD
jgi:hypothetical protein